MKNIDWIVAITLFSIIFILGASMGSMLTSHFIYKDCDCTMHFLPDDLNQG